MTKKYVSIYTVSILLVALAVAGFQAYRVFASPIRVKRLVVQKPVSTVMVPDEQVLREMASLQNDMGKLIQPISVQREPVNLKLFGYEAVQRGKMRKRLSGLGLGWNNTHFLTMAFKGAKKGFCVIDGTFYPQGAQLPDGSIIRTVERNRVLLVKRKRKIWVDMVKEGRIKEQGTGKTGEKE